MRGGAARFRTILVNNAGIDQPPGPARPTGSRTFRWTSFRGMLDVNLVGRVQRRQVFGPAMVGRGRGSIVNIGSLYASVSPDARFYDHLPADPPFLKPPAYGASKAGAGQPHPLSRRLIGDRRECG